MIRLLFIAVAVWLVISIVKRVRHSELVRRPRLKRKGKMVDCEVCGVFLPRQEATEVSPGCFRCDEHKEHS